MWQALKDNAPPTLVLVAYELSFWLVINDDRKFLSRAYETAFDEDFILSAHFIAKTCHALIYLYQALFYQLISLPTRAAAIVRYVLIDTHFFKFTHKKHSKLKFILFKSRKSSQFI